MLTSRHKCGIINTESERGVKIMQLLQYFMAFLVFLAGFAIIDANVNGAFKYNVLAGSLGYLLVISAAAIIFL